MTPDPAASVRFATSTADKATLVVILAALGVLLGFVLPWLGAVAARFPIPFSGPIELLSSFDSPLVVTLRPVIGAVLGLLAGLLLAASTPVVTIDAERVLVRKNGEERVLPKSDIAGIHRQGRKVIIETATGRVLFEDEIQGPKQQIADAFRSHGYPWEMSG